MKNEANVHITKIINGQKQEIHLCDKCAKDIEGIDMGTDFEFDAPFSIQNLLSGMMDYINQNQSSQNKFKQDLICKNCGTSYKEFKESGLLGCSNCYESFRSTLMPVVKRLQADTKHIGKIPKRIGKDIVKKRKINNLKQQLQKSIALEEYEKAAELRDTIRDLQKEE
jgi:protein arginine kinase activator